jgi:hypothetical protein
MLGKQESNGFFYVANDNFPTSNSNKLELYFWTMTTQKRDTFNGLNRPEQ